MQETVRNFVNETRKYVDYDALESKIEQNDLGFIQDPVSVLNVEKMIDDSKSNILKLDSSVDVLSLRNLQTKLSQDMSVDRGQAKVLHNLIEYV